VLHVKTRIVWIFVYAILNFKQVLVSLSRRLIWVHQIISIISISSWARVKLVSVFRLYNRSSLLWGWVRIEPHIFNIVSCSHHWIDFHFVIFLHNKLWEATLTLPWFIDQSILCIEITSYLVDAIARFKSVILAVRFILASNSSHHVFIINWSYSSFLPIYFFYRLNRLSLVRSSLSH